MNTPIEKAITSEPTRKLAMDELIESIEKLLSEVKSGDVVMTAHAILGKAKSLRQKEIENIQKAYDQDLYGGLSGNRKFTDGKDYITQTYNI